MGSSRFTFTDVQAQIPTVATEGIVFDIDKVKSLNS